MANEIPRILRMQARVSEINLKRALLPKKATDRLRNSIRYNVSTTGTTSRMTGEVTARSGSGFPYWRSIDSGTKAPFKGIMPETPDFRAWMQARGIDKKASFPIRRAISKRGLKPTFIFTTEAKRTFVDVQKAMPEAWMLIVRNSFIEFKNF
jgi:hypothetical protein